MDDPSNAVLLFGGVYGTCSYLFPNIDTKSYGHMSDICIKMNKHVSKGGLFC